MTDQELIKQWDEYVESMGSVMGEVEHMAQQMADRIEELEKRNKELTLQLLATSGQAADALDKLTKALEERDEYKAAAEICGKAARAMLADLEGK